MVRLLGIIGCVALAGALLGDVLGVAGDGSRSAVAAMARRPGQARSSDQSRPETGPGSLCRGRYRGLHLGG